MDKELVIKGTQRKQLSEVTFSADKTLAAKRQIRVTAASGKADRVGDIIKIDGIDLTNFSANPVVLWAHDHDGLPVARAVESGVVNGRLVMTFQFATAEEYAFADTVYKLIIGGFINAVSIGARIKSATWIKDEDGNIIGRKFTELELLEVSIVPIPADSKALITAVKSGAVEEADFQEWVAKTLDAPLDLTKDNDVVIDTDRETTQFSDEEETLMKEQIAQLEARIAQLETLIKSNAEVVESSKKTTDAVQTLFGTMLDQVAKKQVPDTSALMAALPEGNPATDMAKKMLALVEQMTGKLPGAR